MVQSRAGGPSGEGEQSRFKNGCFGSGFVLEHLRGVAGVDKPWYPDGVEHPSATSVFRKAVAFSAACCLHTARCR